MKNNYVAKHCKRFNMASVHVNRKRAVASGYSKHKSLDETLSETSCEDDLDTIDTSTPDDEEHVSEDVTDAHTNNNSLARRKEIFSAICPVDEGVLVGYKEENMNE